MILARNHQHHQVPSHTKQSFHPCYVLDASKAGDVVHTTLAATANIAPASFKPANLDNGFAELFIKNTIPKITQLGFGINFLRSPLSSASAMTEGNKSGVVAKAGTSRLAKNAAIL